MNELHDYQKDLWAAISGSGVKPNELQIIFSGRQSGKSMINQYLNNWSSIMGENIPVPAFSKIDKSKVDGVPWYTIKCKPEVSQWIRSRPNQDQWHEHIDSQWYMYKDTFDVCESIYIQLGLKFA